MQQWRKSGTDFIRILRDQRNKDMSAVIVNLLKDDEEHKKRNVLRRKGAEELSW